jgi:hypothetical protein
MLLADCLSVLHLEKIKDNGFILQINFSRASAEKGNSDKTIKERQASANGAS